MLANHNDNQPHVPCLSDSVYPYNTHEAVETQSSLVLASSVATLRTLVPTSTIKPNDVVILVMGKTGSGMSNFINKLTGMPQEDRADELFSCTKDVCAYECCRDGQRFIFVDTPGFNNQKLSQWDVFKKIATWLEKACRHSIELTGVIYTHDISAVGSVATDVQNLQLLVGLCGDEAVDRVRLVTTMCNEVNKSQADEAEGILARTRWRSLIQAGARVKRFDNTSETAWEIVRGLGDTKKTLLLQKELVQTGKALRGTTAGRCLWQKEPVTFFGRLRRMFERH